MKISILAAGAGGMYCGSCLRDSAIAHALRNAGHEVTLIPLYSPLKTERDMTSGEVFYGGVNIYLQHASQVFRKTPRVLDWVFDRPWLLKVAGQYGATSDPAALGDLTIEILKAEDGSAAKELDRLVEFLRDSVKPDVICVPNLMFVGAARELRERVGVPVVCELAGEDTFLDKLKPQDQASVRSIIRERAKGVDRFVSVTKYYAARSAEYLGVDEGAIDVVYTGLSPEYFAPPAANGQKRPLTIGFFGRQCAEKGLGLLVDAVTSLRGRPNMWDVRLKVAGYVSPKDAKWLAALKKRAAAAGMSDRIDWMGEVSLDQKIGLLDSIDVFSMPTTVPEPTGHSIFEALARGVPVVQPRHGSFPEIVQMTGGGVLVKPNDADALADGIVELFYDDHRRKAMGRKAQQIVAERFTERRMAYDMLGVFENLIDKQARQYAAV
ncbi:MAG TPA: glycosyltransferase family 4 protein [Humisphaera sp.]